MEVSVNRVAKKETYTIGRLFVNGLRVCDTLEDTDRGLVQSMSPAEIDDLKVYGETAIPAGRYRIDMETVSNKFGANPWYQQLCGGRIPRLVNVPGFKGILIHPGNTALDSYGCILVGENKAVGKVLYSRATFAKLYGMLRTAHDAGEEIWITIE